MDQQDVKLAVQALWLQYSELMTGYTGKYDWIEDAARKTAMQAITEELPELSEITGIAVAK